MTTLDLNEQAVFDAARKIESIEARDEFLERHDAALVRRVRALLDAHADNSSFLESPAFTLDVPLAHESAIGPYRLLRQIGEGGMGTVYLAEQAEPVMRQVALKVIKPGMDSGQVVLRFQIERQALALMDHPNIARVFDGGTTPGGRPYFVMELVHGVAITKFCDEQRLPLLERLRLFVEVCHAVQHAHQNGIIHRDLKPSNVLVSLRDGKPVPKIIDFGVAKVIEPPLEERTLFTQQGTLVGTLEYMSPEQAEGQGVDTRSDVYSLGVMLYELLAGSTPLGRKRVREASWTEILRAIKEEEPPRPSARLAETEPATLARQVRGELDWIAMKALEKDRARRYASANDFVLDIQRHLDDEPVSACPPSLSYRVGKFARRNKAALAVALVVLLAGLSTLALVLWHNHRLAAKVDELDHQQKATAGEARRADANFALTMAAVDRFLSRIGEERLAQVPGMEQIRREVLEDALVFFQGFLQEKEDEPLVRREAARAYFRVAHIQYLLGRHASAELAYRKAVDLHGRLADDSTDDAADLEALADCHTNLGILFQTTDRNTEAEAAYVKAIDLGEKLVRLRDDAKSRSRLARSRSDLGPLLKATGRIEEAERTFRLALAVQEKLAGEPERRADLARTKANLGLLLKHSGRGKEAEAAYRSAIGLYEELMAKSPAGAAYRSELAGAHLNLGVLLEELDQPAEAESRFRSSLRLAEALATDFPTVPEYRGIRASSQFNLAGRLRKTRRIEEAEKGYRLALGLLERLAKDWPKVPQYRRELAGCQMNLGEMLHARTYHKDADRRYKLALVHLRELAVGEQPKDVFQLAMAHYNHATVLEALGRSKEAEASLRLACDLLGKLVDGSPSMIGYKHLLGAAQNNLSPYLIKRGELEESRKLLHAAIGHQRAALDSNPRHPKYREFLCNHYRSMTELLLKLKEHGKAAATAAEAPALQPGSWEERLRAGATLARCVPLAGNQEVAQGYAAKAVAWLREAKAKGCPNLGEEIESTVFDPLRPNAEFQKLLKELGAEKD